MCTRSGDRPASHERICLFAAIVLSLVAAETVAHAQGYPTRFEFGTSATEQDISAVAIAIPADGAGLPPGSDAEMITLLTTSVSRSGKPLRSPMPRFRMTRADAEAVVAYLRSLNASQ